MKLKTIVYSILIATQINLTASESSIKKEPVALLPDQEYIPDLGRCRTGTEICTSLLLLTAAVCKLLGY